MVTGTILAGIRGEGGQSLVEYAMILVLVALAAVIGLTMFGTGLLNLYQTIVTSF
jgi:Flp pilus assembly pilin Flp